jgi:PAS domain S-box-containing protein
MEKVRAGRQNYFEFRHRLADGSVRNVEVYSSAMEMEGKEVLYSIIHDVSEKQKARELAQYEEYLVNSLMDTTPDLIYFKDTAGRFIRVNRAVLNRFGFRYEHEIIGKTDFDLFSDVYATQTLSDERKIMETGIPLIGLEEKVIWPDGRITWASTSKLPLKDAEGNVIGTFGISRDITEWKQIIES